MKRLTFNTLLMFLAFASHVSAVEGIRSVPEGCDLVGVVHVNPKGKKVDGQARRELNELIPRLRKLCKDKLIRIEGAYASAKSNDDYVKQSMYIAKEVMQYLRKRNAVENDLFIAAMDDKLVSDGKSVVRIVLYPNNYALEQVDCQREIAGMLPR